MYHMLCSLYPEYNWLPWKFEKAPKNIWEDKNVRNKFMKWAAKELNITGLDGWLRSKSVYK